MRHSAAEVTDECRHIVFPCRLLRFVADRHTADRAEDFFCLFVVKVVAVAEADPGTESAAKKVVDDLVEPCEVVDALLTLRLLPARLESHPFDTELGDSVIRLLGVEDVAVEFFKADSHLGILDIFRMFRHDLSDFM